MQGELGQFINGEWRNGRNSEAITVVDPATEDLLAEIAAASPADTQDAIAAATAAQLSWRAQPAWSRADILHKCADTMTSRTEDVAFTQNPKRMRETVARLEAGMVGVNSFALAAAEAPFGGVKASGVGREGGQEDIHDYLNVKLAQLTV